MDDFVGGDDSDNSVFEMYENLKSSFKNGGFNMRKWVSNSKVLQERIEQSESKSHQVSSRFVKEHPVQEEDETYSSSHFKTVKNPTTSKLKVLGVGWDREKDLLCLDLTSPLETDDTCLITKRAILGTTSKLYDPLGLLSPVIILLKIIFQSICKTRVGWDDPVDSFIHEQWLNLVQDAKKVGVVQLKRHYFHGRSTADLRSVQFHGFADGSEKAYGAVVYLRIETTTGTVFTQLVSSKTRVATMNGETIPRLELLGAPILARLVNTVLAAFDGTLKVDSVHCWLDSQIALWWIWGVSREFKQFIQNRVIEIRRLTKPAQWNYCPTESNPADICSRGSMPSKLITNQLWWSGPEFLRGEKEQWPSLKLNSVEVTSNDSDPHIELKEGNCKKKQETA